MHELNRVNKGGLPARTELSLRSNCKAIYAGNAQEEDRAERPGYTPGSWVVASQTTSTSSKARRAQSDCYKKQICSVRNAVTVPAEGAVAGRFNWVSVAYNVVSNQVPYSRDTLNGSA